MGDDDIRAPVAVEVAEGDDAPFEAEALNFAERAVRVVADKAVCGAEQEAGDAAAGEVGKADLPERAAPEEGGLEAGDGPGIIRGVRREAPPAGRCRRG